VGRQFLKYGFGAIALYLLVSNGAVNGTLGALGSRVVMDTRSNAWHGWTQSPQSFRAAGTVTGTARAAGTPRVDTTTFLDQSRSSAQMSPTQALMEARAARGRY
jgi:uncharacterized membrane protein YjjP (DUF1212 family)